VCAEKFEHVCNPKQQHSHAIERGVDEPSNTRGTREQGTGISVSKRFFEPSVLSRAQLGSMIVYRD